MQPTISQIPYLEDDSAEFIHTSYKKHRSRQLRESQSAVSTDVELPQDMTIVDIEDLCTSEHLSSQDTTQIKNLLGGVAERKDKYYLAGGGGFVTLKSSVSTVARSLRKGMYGSVQLKPELASVTMPRNEDVRIIITAHNSPEYLEPVLFSWGVQLMVTNVVKSLTSRARYFRRYAWLTRILNRMKIHTILEKQMTDVHVNWKELDKEESDPIFKEAWAARVESDPDCVLKLDGVSKKFESTRRKIADLRRLKKANEEGYFSPFTKSHICAVYEEGGPARDDGIEIVSNHRECHNAFVDHMCRLFELIDAYPETAERNTLRVTMISYGANETNMVLAGMLSGLCLDSSTSAETRLQAQQVALALCGGSKSLIEQPDMAQDYFAQSSSSPEKVQKSSLRLDALKARYNAMKSGSEAEKRFYKFWEQTIRGGLQALRCKELGINIDLSNRTKALWKANGRIMKSVKLTSLDKIDELRNQCMAVSVLRNATLGQLEAAVDVTRCKDEMKLAIYVFDLWKYVSMPNLASTSLVDLKKLYDVELKARKSELYKKNSRLHSPIFALEDFVKRHFILPKAGYYRIEDVAIKCKIRDPGAFNAKVNPESLYSMNTDNVHRYWNNGKRNDNKQRSYRRKLFKALRLRLLAIDQMTVQLRETFMKQASSFTKQNATPSILFEAKPFHMPPAIDFKNSLLSALYFIAQQEEIYAAREIQHGRLRSVDSLLLDGEAILLEPTGEPPQSAYKCYKGTDEVIMKTNDNGDPVPKTTLKSNRICSFYVMNEESGHARIRADHTTFKTWMLVPNTSSGLRRARRFDDAMNKDISYSNDLVDIYKVHAPDQSNRIKVELRCNTQDLWGESKDVPTWPIRYKQRKFLLCKRYKNMFLLKKLHKAFSILDKGCQDSIQRLPLYLRLILNPTCWPLSSDHDVYTDQDAASIAALEQGNSGWPLSPSQAEGFKHIMARTLSCIWGPPGSGKTRSVARYVLFMIAISRASNFHVLVTASTNSAIRTCMLEISSALKCYNASPAFQNMMGNRKIDLSLIFTDKDEKRDADMINAEIGILHKSELKKGMEKILNARGKHCIVGSTAWRLDLNHKPVFKLVVLDEGSQMMIGEASVALSLVDESSGRVIVCGDHKQLPPIVKGVYGRPSPGGLKLYDSILSCLIRDTTNQDKVNPFDDSFAKADPEAGANSTVFKLRENFRMCKELSDFFESIYGDYKAQQFNINRRLNLRTAFPCTAADYMTGPGEANMRLIKTMLTSEKPLCSLRVPQIVGETLTIKDTTDIEARIVGALVCTYIKNTNFNVDEEALASVLIVTPRHIQRKAIVEQLSQKLPNRDTSKIFVNTAEKCQGKTADLVIVCYTALTKSHAEKSAAFLFVHSRLNVALSRARCKVIILFGNALLQTPLRKLDKDGIRSGFALFKRALFWAKDRDAEFAWKRGIADAFDEN